MTLNNTSLNNKDFTNATDIGHSNDTIKKVKNPLKKAHSIANKTFVVIDDKLVQDLKIDDQNTWFEQKQSEENAIILRLHRFPLLSVAKNDEGTDR